MTMMKNSSKTQCPDEIILADRPGLRPWNYKKIRRVALLYRYIKVTDRPWVVSQNEKKIHGLKDRATRQRFNRVARPLGRVEW